MKSFIKYLLPIWIISLTYFFISCGEDGEDKAELPVQQQQPTDSTDGNVFLPPPQRGIQLVVGPFEVLQGKEIQRNYYMKLPSDVDVDITKIEFAYNKGSHHVNIFKSDTENVPDHMEETFDAVVWEDWDMIAASQKESLVWQMPPGVGTHLKAHQQLVVQVHYVNAATQKTPTGLGKVLVNFHTAAPGEVKEHAGAYFANNRIVAIPPKQGAVFTKLIRPFPNDIKILAMTGHFHSRGKNFIVNIWDEAKRAPGEEIYRNQEWDEPPFTVFNPPLLLKKGKRLIYTTEFFNDTDMVIRFGPHVETEEHANLFMFYYPGPPDGKAIYDFDVRW